MAPPRSGAADQIKAVALKLFAERGIDGATVRQIAEAAGQKNHAAVTYHFGSKDALVRELIVDGAKAIDIRRHRWLDDCELAGGPHDVLEVVEALVRTSIAPDPPPWGACYNRFVVILDLSHHELFVDALADRWNSGYQRCLEHLRRLLPHVPAHELNQRLVFMGGALGGILAAREAALADQSRPHPTWSADATLAHAARSIAAMLQLEDSKERI